MANNVITTAWLVDALSGKEKWQARANDILTAFHDPAIEIEKVSDIAQASEGTWDKILVNGQRLPASVTDQLKTKATVPPPANPNIEINFWEKIYAETNTKKYEKFLGEGVLDSMEKYFASLSTSASKPSLQYLSPQELLVNKKLELLVNGKTECIVPVITEAGISRVDFRFLNKDLISQVDTIKIVSELRSYLKQERQGISVLVGPSGSVKTRVMFDIARVDYCLYFECPSPNTGGSLDLTQLIKLLRSLPAKWFDSRVYEDLEDLNKLICALLFSRAFYMCYLQRTVAITPEDWLLLQLPTADFRSTLLDTFNFCIWLTSRLDGCFVDMRRWLQDSPTTVCVDETNCLFATLEDQFKTSSQARVSFDRPFLFGIMQELNGPIVLAGTKLRLRLLEQSLGSLIGKFMGTDRLRPTWRTFSDIQYIEPKELAAAILARFIALDETQLADIAADVVGRARFMFGFLAALFLLLMNDAVQTDDDVVDVVDVVHQVYFTYRRAVITEQLVPNISNLHASNYTTLFLNTEVGGQMVNIPSLLSELAFASIFRSQFFFTTCRYAIDLISLGVCLLRKSSNDLLWSVGEPWAIEALLQFYAANNITLDHHVIYNQMEAALRTGGAKDSAKGKMLEWLVALRLKSMDGKALTDVPIFQKALTEPSCPSWFKKCTKFAFTKILLDSDGREIIRVLQNPVNAALLVFPRTEARPDIFGVLSPTLLIGACKFLSEYKSESWIDNQLSSDPDNIYCKANCQPYPDNMPWRKLQKEFITAYKNFQTINSEDEDEDENEDEDEDMAQDLPPSPPDGVVRLLIYLPKEKPGSHSIEFTNSKPPKTRDDKIRRNDVILRVSLDNLADFFHQKDVGLIQMFYK